MISLTLLYKTFSYDQLITMKHNTYMYMYMYHCPAVSYIVIVSTYMHTHPRTHTHTHTMATLTILVSYTCTYDVHVDQRRRSNFKSDKVCVLPTHCTLTVRLNDDTKKALLVSATKSFVMPNKGCSSVLQQHSGVSLRTVSYKRLQKLRSLLTPYWPPSRSLSKVSVRLCQGLV